MLCILGEFINFPSCISVFSVKMPDVGALEPEPVEKERADEEDKTIERLREKIKRLPARFIERPGRKISQMPLPRISWRKTN